MAEISEAITKWRELLGTANVIVDSVVLRELNRNVGGMSREVPAILYPSSTEDVRGVIRVANEYGVPIYPTSKGRNWGLGSRLPVRDGCVLLDLSRMNAIRYVDGKHGYAVVEPGVTQWQLYRHLVDKGLPFLLDSTGSGRDTSIIGNTLERGVGYYSSKAERLCGLEIVLGTGEVIKTGFGHYPAARAEYLYPYGVGPDLTGLFIQSNLGVVTSIGIRLIPKRDCHVALRLGLVNPTLLEEFIDTLGDLRRRDIIQSVVHIYNRNRTEITLTPLLNRYAQTNLEFRDEDRRRKFIEEVLDRAALGAWSAFAGLMGTREQTDAALKKIEEELYGIATVTSIDDTKLDHLRALPTDPKQEALMAAIEPIYDLVTKGTPTDAVLESVHWPLGITPTPGSVNPDDTDSGLLFYLPIIPMSGQVVVEVVEETQKVFSKYHFLPYISMNTVTPDALEGVINLAFDRRRAERLSEARRCINELTMEMMSRGIIPYRIDIDSMPQVVRDDPFWRLVRNIKQVTDPKGIISPGRYDLDRAS